MRTFSRMMPVLVLVAVSAACGSSSLTGPDSATLPSLAAGAAASSSNVTALNRRGFAPARCAVEAIMLDVFPTMIRPTDRVSLGVVATFKGDATNCENLVWTTNTEARVVVIDKLGRSVKVYDPGVKGGLVDVTASMPSTKLEATVTVAFPR